LKPWCATVLLVRSGCRYVGCSRSATALTVTASPRRWTRGSGAVRTTLSGVRDRAVFGDQFLEYGTRPLDTDAALAEAFADLT